MKGTISELNIGSLYQGQAVTVHSRVDESVWQGVVDTIETEPTSDQNEWRGGFTMGWTAASRALNTISM